MAKVDFTRVYNKHRKYWTNLGPVHDKLFEKIKKASGKDKILLDMGSGGGRLTFQVANLFHSVYGMDFSLGLLKEAEKCASSRNITNVHFVKGDLRKKFDFNNNYFDVIGSHFVISKMLCPAEICLKEAFRVLKKNGNIIFLCRSSRDPEEFRTENHAYSKAEMEKIMKQIGYKTIRIALIRYRKHYSSKRDIELFFEKSGLKQLYKKDGTWKKFMDNVKKGKKDFSLGRNLLLVEAKK